MEKKTYCCHVGIDVSKATLDVVLLLPDNEPFHFQVKNSRAGISRLLKVIEKQSGIKPSQMLFCAEHTGVYSQRLCYELCSESLSLWMIAGEQTKRLSGIKRGKNDEQDAADLARYAQRFEVEAMLHELPSPQIQRLTALKGQRQQLVGTRASLERSVSEADLMPDKELAGRLKKNFKRTLRALEQDLEQIEAQIEALITSDGHLRQCTELAMSVPGIGKVTALALLLATQGFTRFSSAKELACYAGVVPFGYQSGTSIRGRHRVSKRADQSLKSLLHMAACSAVQPPGELKNYYLRKVREGKNKMSVLNAVRNKLVHRVFAVVSRGIKYEKNYTHSLA